ncbi:hypothetical protein IV203_024583 [Nitzschia inconspicua]|uniref:Uncharacterized protein n=1 Tax=Nitzschia inconspicua TaxID=303405 RepID=A0A9K3K695_9STRA|nr:hypothetical protein IV203_024583 [Nitzschia inconspicua]
MDDFERKALEKPIDKAWLSHPQVGKHTAFDGRLLHGAPGLYFPSRRNNTTTATTDVEPPVKRQKVDTANRKRYTLLHFKQGDSYTPPFSWNTAVDLSKPSQISSKVKLEPSSVDPAGEDEITLCNHHVTVKYNPLMAECHGASNQSSTVELELARDAIQLEVGDVLEDDGGEEGKS